MNKMKKFIIDETGAEFEPDNFILACKYLEENYGDSTETNFNYPCFKGERWEYIKKSCDFISLANYCQLEEGLSVEIIFEDESNV